MSFSARKMVMSPVRKIKNGIRIKRNESPWRSWNISPVFLPALEFWGQRCFFPCICIFLIFVGQNYQAELATAAAATGKNQAKTVCLLTLRSRERRAKRSYMRGGSGSSLMCKWYDDSKDGTCLQLDLHLLISLSIDLALQPTYINICAGTHIYMWAAPGAMMRMMAIMGMKVQVQMQINDNIFCCSFCFLSFPLTGNDDEIGWLHT